MLDETKDSIKSSITERLTSPVLGSFFSFWFILNWKGVYFLFYPGSNLAAQEKIEIYYTTYATWWNGLILPGLLSLAFIYFYPYLANAAFEIWKQSEQEKKEAALKIEKKSVVSGEEFAELETKYHIEVAEFRSRIKSQDEEMERTREALGTHSTSLKKEITELNKKLEQTQSTLDETTKKLVEEKDRYQIAENHIKQLETGIESLHKQRNKESNELEAEYTEKANRASQDLEKQRNEKEKALQQLQSIRRQIGDFTELNSLVKAFTRERDPAKKAAIGNHINETYKKHDIDNKFHENKEYQI